MNDAGGVIVRRWVRILAKFGYGTGRGGCRRWSMDPVEAGVFPDEATAREWLAGTAADVVPAGKPNSAALPAASISLDDSRT